MLKWLSKSYVTLFSRKSSKTSEERGDERDEQRIQRPCPLIPIHRRQMEKTGTATTAMGGVRVRGRAVLGPGQWAEQRTALMALSAALVRAIKRRRIMTMTCTP